MPVALERMFTRKKALVNHCPRCDGLLVAERHPYDECELWRCVACGNRLDATIIENRLNGLTTDKRHEKIRAFQSC